MTAIRDRSEDRLYLLVVAAVQLADASDDTAHPDVHNRIVSALAALSERAKEFADALSSRERKRLAKGR